MRLSVHKNFSDFNEIWYVDKGRWVIHNGIPYDPIQGQHQGHIGQKFVKMANFELLKSISSVGMHVTKRLTVNYDTPRQYLNFYWTDF